MRDPDFCDGFSILVQRDDGRITNKRTGMATAIGKNIINCEISAAGNESVALSDRESLRAALRRRLAE
jgi:hypothetical protein